jgi:hypothetical protein
VTSDSTNNRIIITNGSGGNINAGIPISFDLGNGTTNGFTNPSVTTPATDSATFYARIYTYTTAAAATSHNTNSPSGYQDYGGIALGIVPTINITAKVQETLSFCVYKTTCGDDPSFTIGHTVGTATVIDANQIDPADVNFSISTNANGGAKIRMKGDTLKSNGNSISAAGASAFTFVAGTEKFGVRVSTAGTNITAAAPYNGAAGDYGLDITTADSDTTANIKGSFGGVIATLSGPVNNSVTTLTFAAAASNTTPAGTYTAAEQLITTGSF